MPSTDDSADSAQPDIAVFIPTLICGGAERVAVTLCNALATDKKVHLIVISRQGDYWDMLSPQVTVINLNCSKIRYALFPLVRYLRRSRPPTLLCFLSAANAVGSIANLLAFRPARVVVSERAMFGFYLADKKGIKKFLYQCIPLSYHFAEKLICVSRGVAEHIQGYVALPKRKVIVIYNPTVREEIYRLKDEPADHPWLQPGQPPVLLAVGAFRPEKNYRLLLNAFAKIDSKYQARLLILGEGDGRAALEQQARDLHIEHAIAMPGFKKNPYAYMSRAAAFIMCSDSEGLPNALIEALACGCPVIATDCPGGMREILEDAQYGVLVPKDDEHKLAAAINDTLGQPDRARNRVKSFQQEKLRQFTPEEVICQYRDALFLEKHGQERTGKSLRKIRPERKSVLDTLLIFLLSNAYLFYTTFKMRGLGGAAVKLRGFGIVSKIIGIFGKDRYCIIEIYPDVQFRTGLFDGYWMPLFRDNFIYEPEILYLLKYFKFLDYLFIDGGANYGFWSLIASSDECGHKAAIAVEAVSSTYAILEANKRLNKRSFLTLHNAIEEQSGQHLAININIGHADASLRNAHAVRYEETVETISIDDVVGRHKALEKDFIIIKLDVEGVEIAALKGAKTLLSTKEVLIIYEDHTWDKMHKTSDFMLHTLGYKIYYCDEKNQVSEMLSLSHIADKKIVYGRGYNFIGAKPDSSFDKHLRTLARQSSESNQ